MKSRHGQAEEEWGEWRARKCAFKNKICIVTPGCHVLQHDVICPRAIFNNQFFQIVVCQVDQLRLCGNHLQVR